MRWEFMETIDRPFLDPKAPADYAGFRTRPINEYRFVPWGQIALWALGVAAVAATLGYSIWF